jgi:hypothetical protein
VCHSNGELGEKSDSTIYLLQMNENGSSISAAVNVTGNWYLRFIIVKKAASILFPFNALVSR